MDVSLFDYELPPELIAQEPAEPRDASRLMVLDRAAGGWEDRRFSELPELLRAGDCLVANRSRVMPARLLGVAEPGGQAVELLLIRPVGDERWEAMVRPGRRFRPGARIGLAGGAALAQVVGEGSEGTRVVAIEAPWPVRELMERHGLPPLPPYIGRHDAPKPEDRERYQTVYAREDGSVAAPTAGLHFTPELLARLERGSVDVHYLTLHVGPGTFRPLRAGRVEEHRMEAEPIDIPESTAVAIERARREGRRVVAVGTTTTRALEWAAGEDGRVRAGTGPADLFIRPGHRFRVVDALVTNFHLPRSSLLMLVSAFAGRERVLAAYRHAVAARYRFYSYGDAMLIH
ncbi:MAG TPA: tRNA preQ1(34) S-adenosylmethionine ribosyltransferase-isomerase QueA [Methylomirabilota bacterium]|jgi:S-adenosylmethionine:tRNA ribosyltransferase-isomerase|nr:tRNA preQ1(34) S-adenosylmethionine ribosyltransferase-isomerase QueA [Methylomirabilota bacterium]